MNMTGIWGAIFLRAYRLALSAEFGEQRERAYRIAAYARARYLNATHTIIAAERAAGVRA